jgi:serine phosphatase RsbU (regulator of sigma subunit)
VDRETTNAALRRHVAGLEEAYGLLRAQAETIEQDLRRAERIQRALLPRSAPPMAGVVRVPPAVRSEAAG